MSELSPKAEARGMALATTLSRCAPSATAAKPLRLRAPFSGPPGRKAVHSAPCLSRLLPGAPRFFPVHFSALLLHFPVAIFPPSVYNVSQNLNKRDSTKN